MPDVCWVSRQAMILLPVLLAPFAHNSNTCVLMSKDYVVLLHGLGRTRLSMLIPQQRLKSAGFEVINIQYSSRSNPIEQLAEAVHSELCRRIEDPQRRAHFLTHSLGGLVVRALLARYEFDVNLGNVVMLAPPNQGSQLANRFGDSQLFRATTGLAGQQLRAGSGGVISKLGPVDYIVGVISGNKAISPLSRLLSGDSDGKVTLEETRLEGMADFLTVPRGHTFIMNDPRVIDQAIHFFRNGKFARPKGEAAGPGSMQ